MKQHRVYHQLRDAIYSGRIKPGSPLVERRLAAEFQTSRVPLRESLFRLTAEGLVRRTHGRTSFVEDLTIDDVHEIWLMREALEPIAARLAAAKHSKALNRKLVHLADRMGDECASGNDLASAETDLEFHRVIVEFSRSPRLIRAYEISHVPMLMSKLSGNQSRPELLRSQHRAYAEVLASRDPIAAERFARQHVTEIATRITHLEVSDQ